MGSIKAHLSTSRMGPIVGLTDDPDLTWDTFIPDFHDRWTCLYKRPITITYFEGGLHKANDQKSSNELFTANEMNNCEDKALPSKLTSGAGECTDIPDLWINIDLNKIVNLKKRIDDETPTLSCELIPGYDIEVLKPKTIIVSPTAEGVPTHVSVKSDIVTECKKPKKIQPANCTVDKSKPRNYGNVENGPNMSIKEVDKSCSKTTVNVVEKQTRKFTRCRYKEINGKRCPVDIFENVTIPNNKLTEKELEGKLQYLITSVRQPALMELDEDDDDCLDADDDNDDEQIKNGISGIASYCPPSIFEDSVVIMPEASEMSLGADAQQFIMKGKDICRNRSYISAPTKSNIRREVKRKPQVDQAKTKREFNWDYHSISGSSDTELLKSEELARKTDPRNASYQYLIASVSQPILIGNESDVNSHATFKVSSPYIQNENDVGCLGNNFEDEISEPRDLKMCIDTAGAITKHNNEPSSHKTDSPVGTHETGKLGKSDEAEIKISHFEEYTAKPTGVKRSMPICSLSLPRITYNSLSMDRNSRKKKVPTSRIPVAPKSKDLLLPVQRGVMASETKLDFEHRNQNTNVVNFSKPFTNVGKSIDDMPTGVEGALSDTDMHSQSCEASLADILMTNAAATKGAQYIPRLTTSSMSFEENFAKMNNRTTTVAAEHKSATNQVQMKQLKMSPKGPKSAASVRWRITTESNVERTALGDTSLTNPIWSKTSSYLSNQYYRHKKISMLHKDINNTTQTIRRWRDSNVAGELQKEAE